MPRQRRAGSSWFGPGSNLWRNLTGLARLAGWKLPRPGRGSSRSRSPGGEPRTISPVRTQVGTCPDAEGRQNVRREALMPRPVSLRVPASVAAPVLPFDFTAAMTRLCEDISQRHETFAHLDLSRIAVCFSQARTRVLHGLQAKLTPMRFEGGALTSRRRGRQWTVQRLYVGQREMLYILTFYLPRFLDQTFEEKFITILHELYHVSPLFDGDIRRFHGRCHVHTGSQRQYDARMGEMAREYLASGPPEELYTFLRLNFRQLHERHNGMVGLQVPIPKLIPLDGLKSA